ncbi:hypothetical protein PR048_030521 [Dryococelus australis]|uniref:BHLH domain-containing protein n=1 Tax=Dryococelus australis TaxID=614101 RepID=A0ABQ9G976_9NEOP|nr:hypothetical protein PR048_030521 [Dryococelus australis]
MGWVEGRARVRGSVCPEERAGTLSDVSRRLVVHGAASSSDERSRVRRFSGFSHLVRAFKSPNIAARGATQLQLARDLWDVRRQFNAEDIFTRSRNTSVPSLRDPPHQAMNTLMQRMVGEVGLPQRLPMSPIPMLLQPEAAPKDATDSNNNSNESAASSGDSVQSDDCGPRAAEKYSLRPRSLQKRFEVEQKTRSTEKATRRSSGSRPKQKPPPLSKYRRKTANARERDRMREINAAFESLRRAVPHSPAESCQSAGEKLTKITTLRLAMKYIAALSQALQQDADQLPGDLGDLLSDCGGDAPDLDALLLESDAESLNFQSDLSEHCLTPPDFSDHSLTPADFGAHFMDSSLAPPEFGDPSCFGDHCLVP